MAYMPNGVYEFPEGKYAINWDTIEQIIKSCASARLIKKHSGEVPIDTHFFGPTLQNYETDWGQVESNVKTQIVDLMAPWARSGHSIGELLAFLRGMIKEAKETKKEIQEKRRNLSSISMAAIRNNAENWGMAIEGTKLVRDLSADVIMVGATVVSGGTAVGLVAAGSAMKGAWNYQDKGDVGQAVFEFTGSFILGVIPVAGKSMGAREGSEKFVVMFLDLQFNTAKELMDGKSAGEALKAATIKTVSGEAMGFGANKIIKSRAFQDKLQKWSIPISGKFLSDAETGRVQFTKNVAEKILTFSGGQGVSLTQSKLIAEGPKKTNFSRGGKPFRFTQQATVDEERLLRKAVQYVSGKVTYNL